MEYYFFLDPLDGVEFDFTSLISGLEASPVAFRYPHPTHGSWAYVVCGSIEQRAWVEPAIQANPEDGFYVGYIHSLENWQPSQGLLVDIYGITGENWRHLGDLLIPFMKEFPCSITDDRNTDYTDKYRNHPEHLFYGSDA